jgi:ferredoxin
MTGPATAAPSASPVIEGPAPRAAVADDAQGVRVRAHPGLCEGWGNCHRFAPEVFALDEEGFIDVHLVEVPPEHAGAARLGASSCPEHAITVIGPISTPAGRRDQHVARQERR